MQVNLTFDTQAQGAPQSFHDAVQAAANLLDAAFVDNITVNILVGYGEDEGTALTGGEALGGPQNGAFFSYSQVRSLLAQDLAGAVQSGVSMLPGGSSIQGQDQVVVWNAEEKALGLLSATASGIDGAVGFATDIPIADLTAVALHEIAHAMGRAPEGAAPDIFDLYRYTGQGTLLFDTGPTPDTAAYFSLDGGVTDIADYGVNSDPSDFLNSSGKTPHDAFNETYNSSTLQFLTPIDILQMEALGFHALAHPVGDYHGIGAADVLWRNSNGELFLWGSGVGSGPLQSTQDFGAVSTAWQVVQIGDFNGDGRADILWRNSSTNDVGLWNSVANAGSVSFTFQDFGAASNWQVIGSGDFSGDGPDQILWRNTSTGELATWAGTAAASNVPISFNDLGLVAMQWQVAGVGDFNGDGKADLLWRNTNTNEMGLWISKPGAGPLSFTFDEPGGVASAWQVQGVGDFNGDGKADILWRNTSSNDTLLWIGNGSGAFTFQDLGAVASNWHVQAVADLNGDGKADILWRDDAGDVGWWTAGVSGGAVTFAPHLLVGVPTSWQIQSDWHGT